MFWQASLIVGVGSLRGEERRLELCPTPRLDALLLLPLELLDGLRWCG